MAVAEDVSRKMDGNMTGEPVDLDERRGMAAQKSTEIRRHLHTVQADQAALRRHQDEFEKLLLAAPAKTWPQAAAKAQYLLQLLSTTPYDSTKFALVTRPLNLDAIWFAGLLRAQSGRLVPQEWR